MPQLQANIDRQDPGRTKVILNFRQGRLVGSSTGAVARRPLLGCIRRFHLRARLGVSVAPFPAPATSHAACGFPALRAPAHFVARVMRPVEREETAVERDQKYARPYATASIRSLGQERQDGSVFTLKYSRRFRSCRLLGAFIRTPLPPIVGADIMCSKVPSLHGRYPASSLLQT